MNEHLQHIRPLPAAAAHNSQLEAKKLSVTLSESSVRLHEQPASVG